MENQEIEIKFYVKNLSEIERRLIAAGAKLSQARVLETNLRFDTQEFDLTRAFQVLRLRMDTAARLTFKGPAKTRQGIKAREEIEMEVSDFRKAKQLLEALGYQVTVIYEKYRSIYDLDHAHVALDEMPYGNFVEIEGPNEEKIQQLSEALELNQELSVAASYTLLFDQLKSKLGLTFRDLTFANFHELTIVPQYLGVVPADRNNRD